MTGRVRRCEAAAAGQEGLGCLRVRSVIDLGCRDGMASPATHLKKHSARRVTFLCGEPVMVILRRVGVPRGAGRGVAATCGHGHLIQN